MGESIKITKKKIANYLYKSIHYPLNKIKGFNSKSYWEERYIKGGNSGYGSYGRLAKFKANIINDFVKDNGINLVIEFGCGDGNQLSLFEIPRYIGLDVSRKSINLCENKFKNDNSKSFFIYDPEYFIDRFSFFHGDLTLSLDVIFHLVEDNIYEKYMYDLFSSSKQFVIIYSSDTDEKEANEVQHVKQRNFSKWVAKNLTAWKLIKIIKNKYQLKQNFKNESFSNFYIYKKYY